MVGGWWDNCDDKEIMEVEVEVVEGTCVSHTCGRTIRRWEAIEYRT